MKELLPTAAFIGFTGTPLLKVDKTNSIGTFGPYIHTYKYNEAVADKVVLDLRYEARRVDQNITSQAKIDEWFEERTQGLTDIAKAELKRRWGTMQSLLFRDPVWKKSFLTFWMTFIKKIAWPAAEATPCWWPAVSTRLASITRFSRRKVLPNARS